MSSPSSKMIGLWGAVCLVLFLVCLNTASTQGIRACGKNLNDVLSLLCGNGFGTMVKKSIDPLDFYADSEGSDDTASGLEGLPFMTGIESNSLAKTRRRRLGVVNECCYKPCSISELKSYCRPNGTR